MVAAIEYAETQGNCSLKGRSGEKGCLQYLASTWAAHSKEILGEVRDMSPEVERYVAVKMVQKWLDQGYTMRDVAQIWNSGRAGKCRKGTNRLGVEYDSCAYEERVLAQLNKR